MSDTIRMPGPDQPETYEIKAPGRLNEGWSDWFEGVTITVEAGVDCSTITTLTGVVTDEAALQGLLDRLYTRGLRLLSVRRVQSSPKWDSLSVPIKRFNEMSRNPSGSFLNQSPGQLC